MLKLLDVIFSNGEEIIHLLQVMVTFVEILEGFGFLLDGHFVIEQGRRRHQSALFFSEFEGFFMKIIVHFSDAFKRIGRFPREQVVSGLAALQRVLCKRNSGS